MDRQREPQIESRILENSHEPVVLPGATPKATPDRLIMNLEWITQKGTSLMALAVGLVSIAIAFTDTKYIYFWLCVAIVALVFGYKRFKKRDTPFEKRERELRRKTM